MGVTPPDPPGNKGLGEMMPAQLKETTMDPAKRSMLRFVLLADDREGTADSVERLMGSKGEARFAFIFRQGGIRQRGFAGRMSSSDGCGGGKNPLQDPDFTALSAIFADFILRISPIVFGLVCLRSNSILSATGYSSRNGFLESVLPPVTRSGPNAKLLRNSK